MKKTILGLFAIGMIAAFSSCKKDYTCDCTLGTGAGGMDVSYEMKNVSKKDAKAACDGYQTAGAGLITCTLK